MKDRAVNLKSVYAKVRNKSSEGLLVADLNRQIKTSNNRAAEFLGFKKTELNKKKLDDIVSSGFQKEWNELCNHFSTLENQPKDLNTTVPFLKKDGTLFPSKTSISNYEHPVAGILLVIRLSDVSGNGNGSGDLKKQEERFSKAFWSSPVPLVIKRMADGKITDANVSFLNLLDCTKEDILEKTPAELQLYVHPEEGQKLQNIFFVEGAIRNYELEILTKNKVPIHVLLSAEVLELKGGSHVISSFVDISEKKKTEMALMTINEAPESKVMDRTFKLTAALEREKEMNDMRSRFVAIASHEFRTPLATLLSSLHLAEKYSIPTDESYYKKHIDRIKTAVDNLTDMLNDLLSLDTIERGELKFFESFINIKPFTAKLIDGLKSVLKEGQTITVSYQGAGHVYTDERLLQTILINLLSNASRFSKINDRITVAINVLQKEINISVLDHGIGIPERDQKHIYRLFFRAKNAEMIQGTGLGLAIVKKYLELAGGTIHFSSKENKGSLFSVSIPTRSENY